MFPLETEATAGVASLCQGQGRENPDLQGQGQEVGGLLGLLCCVDLNSAQGVRFNPCKVSGLPPELFLLV